MDLVVGAAISLALTQLYKTLTDVIKTIVSFKSEFNKLKSTLDQIAPIFNDIDELNRKQKKSPDLSIITDRLKYGEDLIILCSRLNNWNRSKIYSHSKKLKKFDEYLRNLFLQAHTLRAVTELSVKDRGLASFVPEEFSITLMKLKMILLGDNALADRRSPDLPTLVIALSSPPGCGKTTLAYMVYHDRKINEKFKENIILVSVTKKVNITLIVEAVFKEMGYLPLKVQDDEDAVNKLEQLLKQRAGENEDPILLVLDDVWPPGLEALVQKFSFPGIRGYKILLTSRYIPNGSKTINKLKPLAFQDAKSLFHQWVFPHGMDHPDVSDETVDKVVEACNGFLLALNLVGISLRGKVESVWKRKLDNWSRFNIFDFNTDLLTNFKTSLDALDEEVILNNVKEGFLDLGLFPKGQKISASVLLDMWVELYELDEEGLDTFENLCKLSTRNLLNLALTKDESGYLTGCYCYGQSVTQHSMLRDLARHQCSQDSIDRRKKLIIEITGEGRSEDWVGMLEKPLTASVVSISTDDAFALNWCDMQLPEAEVLILNFWSKRYSLPPFMKHMKKLKVLIVTNYGSSPAELDNFEIIRYLSSLKRIRLENVSICSTVGSTCAFQLMNLQKLSLTLCGIGVLYDCAIMFPNLVEIEMDYCHDLVELPIGICDIVHLNKISITSCNELRILPNEIRKLTNLQSLRLNSCTKLESLPETISCLNQLSFLDLSDCVNLLQMPVQIGDLQMLRKLHMRGCDLSELPTYVDDLNNTWVFCDREGAKLWRDYGNVVVTVVKDYANLEWLHI